LHCTISKTKTNNDPNQTRKHTTMKAINNTLTKSASTIEKRMIDAVINNKSTSKLIAEVEMLYKEEYLNETDFNFLTDVELIKEIHE